MINIFKTITGFFSSSATGQKSGIQYNEPVDTRYEEAANVSIDSALQVSTVWACVKLQTELVASLPLMTYKFDGERRFLARDEATYKMFHNSPNERQTSTEFWEQMMLNYTLRGNAYAKINRNGLGEAVALWPLSADQVEVILKKDKTLVYRYTFDDQYYDYSESEILHIKGMGNGLMGMSPLDYMRASVNMAIKPENHLSRMYKKDARRPGILETGGPALSKEQRETMHNSFGEVLNGSKELYLLEGAFKFTPLGMSPADIQLHETIKFSVPDICRFFGVPSALVNDTGETVKLGSSTEQIINSYYKTTLRSLLEKIELAINNKVFTLRQQNDGYMVEFNMDALLRASLVERYEVYAKAVQNGINTRNECRKLENNEPIEGADVLTVQVNLIPIDQLGQTNNQGSVPEDTVRQ